jgi:hypothetical protein
MVFQMPVFLEYLIVGILLYVIIFIALKKIALTSQDSTNALIALLATIIVAFSGVVTYIVSYSVTLFSLLLFLFFLLFLVLGFLGIESKVIFEIFSKKVFVILLVGLIGFIALKAFFGVNNQYDLNEPQDNQTQVDTSFNTGVNDITGVNTENSSWFDSFSISSDLLTAVLFLIGMGAAIFFIGN